VRYTKDEEKAWACIGSKPLVSEDGMFSVLYLGKKVDILHQNGVDDKYHNFLKERE